jgi:hypothetical protein
MKIALLLPNISISGGVHVALSHARALQIRGHEITLIDVSESYDADEIQVTGDALNVRSLGSVRDLSFDLVITTWWETIENIPFIKSSKVINFIQSLEYRFYPENDFRSIYAKLLQFIPTSSITVANWMVDPISRSIGTYQCAVVLNGLPQAFLPMKATPNSTGRSGAPLRILVEGPANLEFKGVKQATEILKNLDFPIDATYVNTSGVEPDFDTTIYKKVFSSMSQADFSEVLEANDVLLKLSKVEGMFGPPLEAFSRGCTVVCYPVTGHDEYILDGKNALVASIGNAEEVTAHLKRLSKDRELLEELQRGGIQTAQSWVTMNDSSEQFASLIEDMCNSANSVEALVPIVEKMKEVRNELEALSSKFAELELALGDASNELTTANNHNEYLEQVIVNLEKSVQVIQGLYNAKKFDATPRGTVERILRKIHIIPNSRESKV